jgi:hypothetical protein
MSRFCLFQGNKLKYANNKQNAKADKICDPTGLDEREGCDEHQDAGYCIKSG